MAIEREWIAAWQDAAIWKDAQWGRLLVRGEDRLAFLQRMSTNDFRGMQPGMVLPTVFTTPTGRIVDWAHAWALEEEILLLTSPGAGPTLRSWLRRYIFFRDRVRIEDGADRWEVMGLIGPRAVERLGWSPGSSYGSQRIRVEAMEVLAARTDFPPVIWIIGPPDPLRALQEHLEAQGVPAMGKATWEIWRIEQGIPAWGRELTERVNPLEAGLRFAISFQKGCYIGQEVIARLEHYEKVRRRLMGLHLEEEIPAEGARLEVEGQEVGWLTSSVRSPRWGPIGLGYVLREYAEPGRPLSVRSGERAIPARLATLPFSWNPMPGAPE
ncbi:YgfZ/GcvT domain-containing protein [Thermoflexus sp.]|mgnify:CR=1 FL=1|uniref:CAF17-like 4Fe-4S cluster assembly/insertion protein YgfZ n=1 Tax=Thermoflexus sp. TaxID=1969742 RepID=UPI002ADE5F0B|nr:glycine cleavage T C-terminal barrel domain-containing protein [Thermoflexus sp.]